MYSYSESSDFPDELLSTPPKLLRTATLSPVTLSASPFGHSSSTFCNVPRLNLSFPPSLSAVCDGDTSSFAYPGGVTSRMAPCDVIERQRQLQLDSAAHVCSRISGQLFLASGAVAASREHLAAIGATCIINCSADTVPCYFEHTPIAPPAPPPTYLRLYLRDSPSQRIVPALRTARRRIDEELAAGGRVLVHCAQGVSRSAAIVAGYIMAFYGMNYDAAIAHVRSVREVSTPNPGFVVQLRGEWQEELDRARQSLVHMAYKGSRRAVELLGRQQPTISPSSPIHPDDNTVMLPPQPRPLVPRRRRSSAVSTPPPAAAGSDTGLVPDTPTPARASRPPAPAPALFLLAPISPAARDTPLLTKVRPCPDGCLHLDPRASSVGAYVLHTPASHTGAGRVFGADNGLEEALQYLALYYASHAAGWHADATLDNFAGHCAAAGLRVVVGEDAVVGETLSWASIPDHVIAQLLCPPPPSSPGEVSIIGDLPSLLAARTPIAVLDSISANNWFYLRDYDSDELLPSVAVYFAPGHASSAVLWLGRELLASVPAELREPNGEPDVVAVASALLARLDDGQCAPDSTRIVVYTGDVPPEGGELLFVVPGRCPSWLERLLDDADN